MKIKVCGMKYPQNIDEVANLNPDYLGFICYPKSARYMGGVDAGTIPVLPPNIIKTGVFVDEGIDTINELVSGYDFTAVQLHGNESAEICNSLRHNVKVIKAFGVDENFNFDVLNAYAGQVDYFLFDTKTDTHGGSGISFNWDMLDAYTLNVPFFLSGGLSIDNLENVMMIKHPAFYGVDLNSRFELQPGLKDINKLRNAFNLLRAY